MASEERRETLLNKREEKHYYENCPGCKMDLHKAGQTGLPVKELFTIWVVVLGTGNIHHHSKTLLFVLIKSICELFIKICVIY